MQPEFVYGLACRHGHPLMDMEMEGVEALYHHADFEDFLRHFKEIIGVLQSPADLHELVLHFAGQARQSNIVYAEVHLTPLPLVTGILSYPMLMEAVGRGISEAKGEGIEIRVIVDTVRQLGREHVAETLRLVKNHPYPFVIGFGIGGSEGAFPAGEFEEYFAEARAVGLKTVAHSGECSGPDGIWETLDRLHPARVLHGITAAQDGKLLERLKSEGIPLDVCPTSNVMTGVVSSMEEHPLPKLIDAGVRVTINTDDPAMFGTTLNREYRLLHEIFSFSAEDILKLAGEAFRSAFLSEDQKRLFLEAQSRVFSTWQDGSLEAHWEE